MLDDAALQRCIDGLHKLGHRRVLHFAPGKCYEVRLVDGTWRQVQVLKDGLPAADWWWNARRDGYEWVHEHEPTGASDGCKV